MTGFGSDPSSSGGDGNEGSGGNGGNGIEREGGDQPQPAGAAPGGEERSGDVASHPEGGATATTEGAAQPPPQLQPQPMTVRIQVAPPNGEDGQPRLNVSIDGAAPQQPGGMGHAAQHANHHAAAMAALQLPAVQAAISRHAQRAAHAPGVAGSGRPATANVTVNVSAPSPRGGGAVPGAPRRPGGTGRDHGRHRHARSAATPGSSMERGAHASLRAAAGGGGPGPPVAPPQLQPGSVVLNSITTNAAPPVMMSAQAFTRGGQRLSVPPLVPQPIPYQREEGGSGVEGAASSTGGGGDSDAAGTATDGSSSVPGPSSDALADGASGSTAVARGDATEGEVAGESVPAEGSSDQEAVAAEGALAGSRFECSICFEYMDDPSGCGHCEHRFCRPCIARVIHDLARVATAARRSPETTSAEHIKARCPCCRSPFGLNDIVRDTALRARIASAAQVTCPFPGCGKKLKLTEARAHEASCPYMMMRCRYAQFGCGWTGPKMELEEHDKTGCSFAKIGVLVEQLRQTRAEHGHMIASLQQQLGAANQMLHVQGSNLMRLQSRSASNVFDVLTLAHLCTCHPVRFLRTKDLWRQMHSTPVSRATICNFLYLFPSVLLVIRVAARGIRLLFHLDYHSNGEDLVEWIDTILLAFALGIIGILFVACFFLDAGTSKNWSKYQVRPGISLPVIRDVAALALVAIHFSCIEFDGGRAGFGAWGCVCIPATYFPAIVAAMLEYANNVGLQTTEARARCVTLFGIRYGFLAALCGIVPCFDAVLALRLMKGFLKLPTTVTLEESECFLAEITSRMYGYVAAARIAIFFAVEMEEYRAVLVGAGAALGMLLIVNHVVYKLNLLGATVGKKLGATAAAVAGRNNNTSSEEQRSDRIVDGAVFFCFWVAFLGCIVIS